MIFKDRKLFFLALLRNPRHVGSVVPSSRVLARAVAAQLSVGEGEYVLELGPGTGVISHALFQAGITQQQLIMIERDHGFLDQLKRRFPHARVLQGDARNMQEILLQHNISKVAAVVSSLPLLSMPDGVRHKIVHEAFEVIKPGGVFIQYTYGLLSPVPEQHQRAIGISGSVAKRVWRNIPPARVWCYTSGAAA